MDGGGFQAAVSLLLCRRGLVGPSRITMAFGVSGSGSQGSVFPKALGVLDNHWCEDGQCLRRWEDPTCSKSLNAVH